MSQVCLLCCMAGIGERFIRMGCCLLAVSHYIQSLKFLNVLGSTAQQLTRLHGAALLWHDPPPLLHVLVTQQHQPSCDSLCRCQLSMALCTARFECLYAVGILDGACQLAAWLQNLLVLCMHMTARRYSAPSTTQCTPQSPRSFCWSIACLSLLPESSCGMLLEHCMPLPAA
jgi:hypothetical protein